MLGEIALVDIAHGASESIFKMVKEITEDKQSYAVYMTQILCYMVGHHLSNFPNDEDKKQIHKTMISVVDELVNGYENHKKSRKKKIN